MRAAHKGDPLLRQRRLLERNAQLRATVAAQAATLVPFFQRVDAARAVVSASAHGPGTTLVGALLAFVLARRSNAALRMVGRLWWLWRAWRGLRQVLR